MVKDVIAVLFIYLALLNGLLGQNIVRHSCGIEAEFFKIASDNAMVDALSYTVDTQHGIIGCIDACVANTSCKAFNAKRASGSARKCELLRYDRSSNPNDITSRVGWDYYDTGLYSSKVGYKCESLKYNPCYPCRCIDSCYTSIGYTCNCTSDMPKLPNIYLAFESTTAENSQKFAYDRGQDQSGASVASLKNGAFLGQSNGRPGKVLKIIGVNAGVRVGYFQGHNINNPANSKFTISLWIKILSPYSGQQTIFGCGRLSYFSGTLLHVTSSGKVLTARVITTDYHYSAVVNIKDTLTTWTHVAIAYKNSGPDHLRLYVNARKVATVTSRGSTSTSMEGFSNLIFGAGGLAPLNNENFNIHLDDFAYWDYALSDSEIIFVQNKGYV